MIKIKQIFIDMDGVLVDFVGGALKAHGIKYRPEWPSCVYRMSEALGMTDEEFWLPEMLTEQWWAKLLPEEWATSLCVSLESKCPGLRVLTKPVSHSGSWAGKKTWLCRNLPGLYNRVTMTDDKALQAKPGVLLIDDCDEECDRFIEAGGEAVCVPRPWNSQTQKGGIAEHVLDCVDAIESIQPENPNFPRMQVDCPMPECKPPKGIEVDHG